MKTPYDFYMPGLVDTDDGRMVDAARALAPGLFEITKPLTSQDIGDAALAREQVELGVQDKKRKLAYADELSRELQDKTELKDVLTTTARVSAKYGQNDDMMKAVTGLEYINKREQGKYFNPKSGLSVYVPGEGVKVIAPGQKSGKTERKYVSTWTDYESGRRVGMTADGNVEYIDSPMGAVPTEGSPTPTPTPGPTVLGVIRNKQPTPTPTPNGSDVPNNKKKR